MKKTLAIFSPTKNACSETFIQAHKNLPFNIKYYYSGFLPTILEGKQSLFEFTIAEKIKIRINKKFSLSEHALMNSLKRENVDCVLAEYGPTACAVLKVVEHLKIPMVVHFFGYDASVKSILNEYGTRYRQVFSYANTIIVVSRKMKSDLITLGCPSHKLLLSICGPDPNFFENRPCYLDAQFISVARFVEKKAPYLTIIAFKKVAEEFPYAKLIMIGDGQLMGICKNLVRGLGLENNIEFKGIQNPNEIRHIYEKSLAFVQHSIVAENGDCEGTPVAILDAQASALPVISTIHAGIPDVVINDETGLLVEEWDVEGMTKNMIRILVEEGLAEKLGKAGRKRIMEHFTMEKHLNVLRCLIKTI